VTFANGCCITVFADKNARKEMQMNKSGFSLTQLYKDEAMVELVRKTNQKILAAQAIDCAERVMPYFEEKYPQDKCP